MSQRGGSKLGEVAGGLGITATTLAAWRDRMKGREDAPPGWTMEDMHAEVLRLREELSSVTAQRDVLKKACGILCEPPEQRYAAMKAEGANLKVADLCRAFDVSRSGYYA